MIAKQLSNLLTDLCHKSDVTTDARSDMDRRFESLRGYGRLPRGRENRARALTDDQIVAAVLGLTAAEPGWAGHVATLLARLKPVGGKANRLADASTLTEALITVLSDKTARETIIAVRLSKAEAGTNNNGIATITTEVDGSRREQAFVSSDAVTLLQAGADESFDPELRNAPVSRELVFNRRFFERLARAVEHARAHPSPPTGDGSEYDEEDAERERRRRLGATPSSNFLNIGVDNQVTWPREETLIDFDRYKLVLMPKTARHMQSIHIDLYSNNLSTQEALTVINRFLSLLTWCDDQYAIAQDGWSGSPIPLPVSKRDLAFTTTYHWLFKRDIPASNEGQRALALYREARNAEQNFMISYAVLNYYKIIEIRYADSRNSKPARDWISQNFPSIRDDPQDQHGIADFLAACGGEPPDQYIYKACRVAVAHTSNDYPSDPDDAAELRRLHNAAEVMRRLARRFISLELGVSDSPF